MHKLQYEPVAEDFIAMVKEQPGGFSTMLAFQLIIRSRELPSAAKSDQLLSEVLEVWVSKNFLKLTSFRVSRYMQPREIPMIVAALKPLCCRAWPMLNAMLMMDRDNLFQPHDYTKCMGPTFYEEAPSVTFVRFLNDMKHFKDIRSETYERNVSRISEVHALSRVANIMPQQFHTGIEGRLKPGQTIEAAKWAEVLSWRERTGIHTVDDLLADAGLK